MIERERAFRELDDQAIEVLKKEFIALAGSGATEGKALTQSSPGEQSFAKMPWRNLIVPNISLGAREVGGRRFRWFPLPRPARKERTARCPTTARSSVGALWFLGCYLNRLNVCGKKADFAVAWRKPLH